MQRASNAARLRVPRLRFSLRIRRNGLCAQVACLGQLGRGIRSTRAALHQGLLMPLQGFAEQLVHDVKTITFSHHL